jgi:hypothetical protein
MVPGSLRCSYTIDNHRSQVVVLAYFPQRMPSIFFTKPNGWQLVYERKPERISGVIPHPLICSIVSPVSVKGVQHSPFRTCQRSSSQSCSYISAPFRGPIPLSSPSITFDQVTSPSLLFDRLRVWKSSFACASFPVAIRLIITTSAAYR